MDAPTTNSTDPLHQPPWVDERAGKIFRLVDAPDAGAEHTVHREAHGLVADEIYEVAEGVCPSGVTTPAQSLAEKTSVR